MLSAYYDRYGLFQIPKGYEAHEEIQFNIVLLHILNAFQNTFTMEANIMNPDQTAPKEQSDLGPYCL